MEENALELALRGKPRDPFYMVGSMGEQSVVIRAEKGQVRMLVDGEAPKDTKELVYELVKEDSDEGETKPSILQPGGESKGGAHDLERPAVSVGTVPGEAGKLDAVKPLAERSYGRDGEGVIPGGKGEAACALGAAGEACGEEGNQTQWYSEAGGAAQDYPAAEDTAYTLMTVEVDGERWTNESRADEG